MSYRTAKERNKVEFYYKERGLRVQLLVIQVCITTVLSQNLYQGGRTSWVFVKGSVMSVPADVDLQLLHSAAETRALGDSKHPFQRHIMSVFGVCRLLYKTFAYLSSVKTHFSISPYVSGSRPWHAQPSAQANCIHKKQISHFQTVYHWLNIW